MTVHFIGAGPGDPDLITIRGRNLIKQCNYCLYAGSLVPKQVVEFASKDAIIIDTASLNLDEIIEIIATANDKNEDVARVHSGDPSLYGAIAEQIRRLKALNIAFEITPGVPAFAAAAAALGQELTLPEVSQSVVLTRTSMKSSKMPRGEELENLGSSKATVAIHLSIRNLRYIRRKLEPIHGPDYPVTVVYRVTWPDQKIIRGTLSNIFEKVRAEKLTRTALILIGPALEEENYPDSALYDANQSHLLRTKKDLN
ncbi:MAG: precorrin-4 C(11)-methyltransferase [Alphaproteobacteria bacterium]|nr:precorrin-4 C(11)-methyltransferase [Alphaproteobacteria bacterium]MDG1888485.1 precorrin-4 C(11)-methyltransferase [Alphaproteobacteria bacterium]